MKVCIVGAGAGGRSASGRIRELDKEAQIDVFTKQSEIGYAPCELPFVLRGDIVTWDDIFYPPVPLPVHHRKAPQLERAPTLTISNVRRKG